MVKPIKLPQNSHKYGAEHRRICTHFNGVDSCSTQYPARGPHTRYPVAGVGQPNLPLKATRRCTVPRAARCRTLPTQPWRKPVERFFFRSAARGGGAAQWVPYLPAYMRSGWANKGGKLHFSMYYRIMTLVLRHVRKTWSEAADSPPEFLRFTGLSMGGMGSHLTTQPEARHNAALPREWVKASCRPRRWHPSQNF